MKTLNYESLSSHWEEFPFRLEAWGSPAKCWAVSETSAYVTAHGHCSPLPPLQVTSRVWECVAGVLRLTGVLSPHDPRRASAGAPPAR